MNTKQRLVVNFEKEQYFLWTEAWETHLALLQGSFPGVLNFSCNPVGAWRDYSVQIVVPAGRRQSPEVVEQFALYALAGHVIPSPYVWVRDHFTDLTKEVGGVIASEPALHDPCFGPLTRPPKRTGVALPPDYSWLTLGVVQHLLQGVEATMGKPFFCQYTWWLAERLGVPKSFRQLWRLSGNHPAVLDRAMEAAFRWQNVWSGAYSEAHVPGGPGLPGRPTGHGLQSLEHGISPATHL